ncbi:MAG: ATP-binding protein [Bacteroidetes bacterium]|nr:ATP-binding protein [Bacteroidota bacterium]
MRSFKRPVIDILMKEIVAVLIASLFWTTLYAREGVNERIDSLTKVLRTQIEDTNKVILLNELTTAYWEIEKGSSSREAAQYLDSSIRLSRKLSYKRGYANALLNRGKFEISTWHKFADATTDLLDALYNFNSIKDSSGISKCYLQLGVISFILLYHEDAVKNLEQSVAYASAVPGIKATATYLIALSYSELKMFAKAKTYFSSALQAYRNLNNEHGERECYIYMGKMYVNDNMPDSGFYYLNKSIIFTGTPVDSSVLGRPYSFLSSAFIKQKNADEAIRYALISYRLGRKSSDEITVIESANTLQEAYSLKKDFSKAYFYLKELKEMKDSIFNSSVAQRVAESKSKFVFEKELSDRKMQQEKEEAIAKAQIQKQKIVQYAFIIGTILLVILLLVILNRSRLKQKSAKQLTEAYDNLKATQQQLVQQEKLASLGALTAGIAHEIKNPLNFVNNFSDLSIDLINEIDTLDSEEERKEVLSDIKTNLAKIAEHGKRADNIVKSMLQHSRSGLGDKQMTDINRQCSEFIDLAFHGLRAKISDFNSEIIKSLAVDLPRVNVIPQDFSRVILNLSSNAFYAVKKRADSIQPDPTNPYRPQVIISTKVVGDKIEVVIRDNGNGIPSEIKEKIFEPFFTTKPSGEGTGLGLSICYDIIKAHGGEIKVESKENEFTQFSILLPAGNDKT